MATFKDMLAAAEADASAFGKWLEAEAGDALASGEALVKTVFASVEPALFSALETAVEGIVAEFGKGVSLGQVATDAIARLPAEFGPIVRTVDSELLTGLLGLLSAKSKASAPVADATASDSVAGS